MRTSANSERVPCLVMRRGPEPLPPLDLPDGVSLFGFNEAGGGEAWEHIVNTAFGSSFAFDRKMRAEPAFRPERILFLAKEGQPIAVAAAWQRDKWPPGTGYLHYVGVLPEAQGQGLGYWVSLAALHQMRREGKTQAVLETHDHRLAALKTYLRLGFVPDIASHESYAVRWAKIMAKLG